METCEVLCYGEIGIDNIIQADGLPSPEQAIFPKSDSLFPDVGRAMLIPVRRSLHDGFDDGVDVPKPAAFEGQAAQLLPPGLDQIQPAGILRDEQHCDLGPRDQRGLCLPREMRAQIISDQHPLPCGIGLQHLLQELNEAGAVPSWAAPRSWPTRSIGFRTAWR